MEEGGGEWVYASLLQQAVLWSRLERMETLENFFFFLFLPFLFVRPFDGSKKLRCIYSSIVYSAR